MKSLFESLFTTKDIIRKKYPGGWAAWINQGMSDEDDGQLTRFTTMDGRHMHTIVNKLIGYGFAPPNLIEGVFHFKDYYLDVYEYYHYLKRDVSKYTCKAPEWLKINAQPFISLKDIDKKGLNISDYNGLEYSLNVKNKNEVYKN
jgi:hypothetical protein|tara:strand:- start:7010 stop:7444 length:435 start_codon:yes stop_codon:yes gene_type:complete